MIVFPNAKINLGLHVQSKRTDGYHNIATVFYPTGCTDLLELVQADKFSFNCTGLVVDGETSDNLCVRAYHLLQKYYPLPPVAIHLHKKIPSGAGLGGGSSDGAFMLALLNQVFSLNISAPDLASYALQLGSDCPFFISNSPAYATGRGEQLQPLEIPELQGKKILLVDPGVKVNTGWAFSQIQPDAGQNYLPDILQQPINTWKEYLFNDFEPVIKLQFPELRDITDRLYSAGALYAAMTGSGSSFFGIFHEIPPNYSGYFASSHRLLLG